MLFKRIVVGDQERFLITKNGRFAGILLSGEYRMFVPPGVVLVAEKFNLRTPVFESTWTVMPESSIDCRRRSPISGSSSIGFGPVGGGFRGRNPRRLMAPGSIRRTICGAVKCSSSATTRISGDR